MQPESDRIRTPERRICNGLLLPDQPRLRRPIHSWQWQLLGLLSSSSSSPAAERNNNHVSWEETAAAHLYSASLPGVRKEEIRVEVEDARYIAIRTEFDGDGGDGRRSFARKFRLPAMVDVDGISAEYTHGVLRITVPRLHTRARPVVNFAGAGAGFDPVARAA
uniref:SHSP domain-containing protein n=1 Tax=Leersia perrieri TaxID=77586 RepID=A0A0D9WZH4_9ORYZ